jgi:hypothetical protein
VNALWSRRAVRHLAVGLLPLLVLAPVVVAVLAVRLADVAAPLRDATARATATVERIGLGPDGRDFQVAWTDEGGVRRTGTVLTAERTDVPVGARVAIRYQPADPRRVFVTGDETSTRIGDLTFGVIATVLLLLAAVGVSVAHVLRRLAMEKRPAAPLPVTVRRSRLGLGRRAWLLIEDGGRSWWTPVRWEPVLEALRPGTRVPVHGRPAQDRVLVADVEGTAVWQVGRRRLTPPRGEVEEDDDRAPAGPVSLVRQLRADAAPLAAAPVLGLLWAYVDDGGAQTWAVASILAAAALFWLVALRGSDPT